MGNRPAFHCGAESCCEGDQYPECQQVQTSDGRNYTIDISDLGPARRVVETSTFRYDPDQDYTDHQFTD